MTLTSCTEEVRVKVPSFQKVSLFKQYDIVHRDVMHIYYIVICLSDVVILGEYAPKVCFDGTLRFFCIITRRQTLHEDKQYRQLNH